jgi:aldehyde dehydrogenase (NAD+)
VLRRVGDLLSARKEEIANLMTREMGKPLQETRGDVQEGIDTAYYAADEGRRLFGHVVPSELRNKWAMTTAADRRVRAHHAVQLPARHPDLEGVPGAAVRQRGDPQAAEDVPHTATVLVEVLLEAGLRPRSCSSCTGWARPWAPRSSSTRASGHLVHWLDRDREHRRAGVRRRHKRLSLEMGGKNAQIVLDDADLELAIEGALWGAFGTTGQRCTATSRLVLQDGIHDEFVERLAERARALVLGDGRTAGTDVGPLIHEASRDKVERYVEIGMGEGAELVTGGRRAAGGALEHGCFFEPTIFTNVKPGSRWSRRRSSARCSRSSA